jgi:predicted transposase/invertase (TIGR01784 family)
MTEIKRLNPRIDIAFKKIFGVEENKDLLISLINAIVNPDDHVSEITLLNPYNVQNFKTDKLSILDIKAKNSAGKHFNIEMQITDEGDYSQRALYYWSKMYSAQISAGGTYASLCKTIGIHILNFASIKDDRYHHTFDIRDSETNNRHFNHFEMHTLELSKFCSENTQLTDLAKKIKTSLDRWMAFLTRNDLLIQNQLPSELDDRCLNKAIGVLDVMNLTAIEREIYENREKFLMIEASALEHQFVTGKAEGRRDVALEMLNDNEPDAKILKYAKITPDELVILKQSLKT